MYQCVLNYTINKGILLGKGGFGSVYLAQNELNQEYACKIISLQSSQNNYKKLKQLVDRELSIMSTLDNQNIVKMAHSYFDGKNIYIFMEYCNGGNLKKKIRELQSIYPCPKFYQQKYEKLAQEVFWDIIDSLNYLYSKNIIHRDIKLENVLIHNGKYKLSDFGLSKFLSDIDEEPMSSILGTPCYQSPQLLRQQVYSPKTDIWSLGVLLYELLKGGELPFRGFNTQDLLKDIENKLKTNYIQNQLLSVENKLLQYLVSKMLVIDEEPRLSLKDLLLKVNQFRINAQLMQKENITATETRCKPYRPEKITSKKPTNQIQEINKKESIPLRFIQTYKEKKLEATFISKILDDKLSSNILILLALMLFIALMQISIRI
ncbi:unnamed protein product [Paramecium octaurelia]|uniref:Protein kinase domain-containing protein n=1 Tax=Paramecium octaurelia TaxID=43137 RepID=A0A8S1SJZ6_PAROT|nr:unnamed protein product [Paramecium octaurelia]